MLQIAVKLCGNCNPRYDAMALLRRIGSKYGIQFCFGGEEAELYLNGCETCCELPPPGQKRCAVVVVGGDRLNGKLVPHEQLEAALSDCLLQMLRP